MYPTLTDLIEGIFGVRIPLPIQSYGFMVAMAFLAGAWVIVNEFKRKEKEGKLKATERKEWIGKPANWQEMAISGLVSFVIGFKLLYAITDYSTFVDNPQKFILSGDGSWLGGILFAAGSVYLTWRDKNKQKLAKPRLETKLIRPHEQTGNILMVAAVSGIIGSKIAHNLENIDDLIANPIDALLSFSGLSFYGGLIFGAIAVIWYTRKHGMKVLHVADVAAPALAIAYAVGRMGCQISGDGCWGVENTQAIPSSLSWLPDWVWSSHYPNNVINAGEVMADCAGKHCHALVNPVFPTPIYETTMMIVIFLVLWFIRKRINIPGMIFSIYLIFAGFERFFIEKIRVNNVYHIFGAEITQAEIISTFSILLGIAGVIVLYRNKEKLKTY